MRVLTLGTEHEIAETETVMVPLNFQSPLPRGQRAQGSR